METKLEIEHEKFLQESLAQAEEMVKEAKRSSEYDAAQISFWNSMFAASEEQVRKMEAHLKEVEKWIEEGKV